MKKKIFKILVSLGVLSSSSFAGTYDVLEEIGTDLDQIELYERPGYLKLNSEFEGEMLNKFTNASEEEQTLMFKKLLNNWQKSVPPTCDGC